MSDLPDMTLRLGKSKKTGTGCKRDPLQPRKGMKAVSRKQARRNVIVRDTLKDLLKIQSDLYGREFCCICLQPFSEYLKPTFGHLIPKGRHLPGADSIRNGEPECWPCNSKMGSREHDYRELIYKMAVNAFMRREVH
jgi:5-methylcytosine-specific restriction endonuclease McrA